jgi:glycosyltransferase involved in cell wall biosynthesis
LQTLGELSRRHTVTVLTTHADDEDTEALRQRLPACRIESVPHDPPKVGSRRFPLALAGSWLSRYPVEMYRWRSRAIQRRARALVAEEPFDLCVADFLLAFANLPRQRDIPIVLFEHNVEYLIWRRLAAVEPTPWRRALMELEWRKLRRQEAAACARADLTIAVSDADRRQLQQLAPDARMATIPTGVDTTYFKANGREQVPARLVFTGSMDWHPNEDAIVHFAESMLPRIREGCPDVSLTVAGRNPGARLRAVAADRGIRLTGTVDDVRPHIDEAAVYIAPLRVGSGTRLKIFEAFAMGKPVVSTTIGAEGLTVTPGKDIVLADDPEHFASEVITLLRDPERRAALGQAGRHLVESRYSWSHIAAEFEACCHDTIARSERIGRAA